MDASQTRTMPRKAIIAVLAGWCLATAAGARGEILDASGRVEASVRQISAATGQIVDEAFEQTPGTTNILPAVATATLQITEGEASQGELLASAAVNPPAELPGAAHKDFNLEASGLSRIAGRGFTCDARSVETREIVLTAGELDLPPGEPIRVRSTLSLSAGVLLVTLPQSMADVRGTISFTLTQRDSQGSRVLLDGMAEVFFDIDGALQFTATGDVPLTVVVPMNLTPASSEIDQAHLVLLPLLELPYEYDAVVGEPFDLVAEITASVDAPSGAQGGSAFVGQGPAALTDALNEDLQVDLAPTVMEAIDLFGQQTTIIDAVEVTRPEIRGCGGLGLETLFGALALTAGFIRRRTWWT